MKVGLTGLSGMSALLPGVADVGVPTISAAVIPSQALADQISVTFAERVRSPGNDPSLGWSCVVGAGAQRETATIVGSITHGGAGDVTVTVTAAGVPALVAGKVIQVAVANGDTAALVAGKVRDALNLDGDVTGFFTVGGADATVLLTAKAKAADDAALNIAYTNGTCHGLTPAPTSANSVTGIAAVTQIETATAVGTATGAGTITLTVTGALVGSSPKEIALEIANEDTPTMWAAKVRTALDIADITTNYTVGGADAVISLTAKVAAANDVDLNIAITDTDTTGITAVVTSDPTRAGVAGQLQAETATIVGTITASGAGNVAVTVTAANSANLAAGKLKNIVVADSDTAAQVADKIRVALVADADIGHVVTGFFTVTGADAEIILTAKAVAADDATMNLAYTNGTCAGLTPGPNSVDTVEGGAARVIDDVSLAADWGSLTILLASAVSEGEAVRLAYNADTGDLADVAGNVLATVASYAVTNSVDATKPTLATAVIADAAPFSVVLTFDEALVGTADLAAWTITVGGVTVELAAATLDGAVLTLLLAAPIVLGNVVKAIYSAVLGDLTDLQGNVLDAIAAPGSAVTNNVTTTKPSVTAASIAALTPTVVDVTFTEKIASATSDYLAGFTLKKAGVAVGVLSATRSVNQNHILFTLAVAALTGQVFTVSYAAAVGNVADLATNVLNSFTNQAVTNNVT